MMMQSSAATFVVSLRLKLYDMVQLRDVGIGQTSTNGLKYAFERATTFPLKTISSTRTQK
jgi:hypothetical protein